MKGNCNILVTGGTGYLGSHAVVALIQAGYCVTIIDNLINSNEKCLTRIKKITGCDDNQLKFYKADIRNADELESVFQKCPVFYACHHFAGLKSVYESTIRPIDYYGIV